MRAILVAALPALVASGWWNDCSAEEKVVNPSLTFSDVTSTPDPVVDNSTQYISKTLHYHGSTPVVRVTARLEQYWKIFNRTWFRFLAIDTDLCREHANACPLTPNSVKKLTTQHPPLARGTPHGWYRSKQVYRNKDTGEKLGCVDMRFQYCRTVGTCKYDRDEEREATDPVAVEATNGEAAAALLKQNAYAAAVATKEPEADAAGAADATNSPCCKACAAPRSKYYSVDVRHGFCGESCMLPALFPVFKVFEPNLTLAASRDAAACAAQLTPHAKHYTVYNGTVVHGVPHVLSVELDLYAPGEV